MNAYVTVILVVLGVLGNSRAGVVPAALSAAPVVAAPAAIGYTKAVPYNVPPYASRVDINTRNLAPLFASAPVVAAPYVAAPGAPVAAAYSSPIAAPVPAPIAAPFAAYAAPSAPLAAAYAAPAAPVAAAYAAPAAPVVAAPGLVETAYAGSLAAPFAQPAVAAFGPAVLG